MGRTNNHFAGVSRFGTVGAKFNLCEAAKSVSLLNHRDINTRNVLVIYEQSISHLKR